ncbi:MAG: DUF2784 domain-containing protein [Pseudomonadota bacterium]|nr:DUF2784 domain-containing protein [Pseudomonadota bacterium]
MLPALAADLLVLLHLAFILFVALGGLLVLRWARLAWVHLPAASWGAAIELTGWICPLTPLENHLRRMAGSNGYSGGFIEHYIVPLVYPPGLTRSIQISLGIAVLAVNALAYAALIYRLRRASS